MCRRKEDICSAVGGAVATGAGSVSTSTLVPAAEVAVALAPSVVPSATSGKEEAAGVAAADVAVAMASLDGRQVSGVSHGSRELQPSKHNNSDSWALA